MKVIRCMAVAVSLCILRPIYAGENTNSSNCLRHLGGGGFSDFDCYEANARWLESDSQKLATAIKKADGLSDANRARFDRYMRTQDDAVKACDMTIEFSYAWKIVTLPKTHRDLYDVMAARCRYALRKQQNDFLRDLYSIND